MDIDKTFFEQYALLGKALSNANRLEILNLLMQSEKTVESIAKETNLSIANVSKHLQVLLKAHLVKNKKCKNYILYQIFDVNMLNFLTIYFETTQTQIEQIEELKQKFVHPTQEAYTLTLNQLEKKLESDEIILVDVRPSEEFMNAHIPGAISMPVKELEHLMELLPKDKTIVAYCRGPHCLMSSEAIEILEKSGRHTMRFSQSVTDWNLYKEEFK